MSYRPLSAREASAPTSHDALHEGVPAWLRATLWNWIEEVTFDAQTGVPSAETLRAVERNVRIRLDWTSIRFAITTLKGIVGNAEKMLDVVDFLLLNTISHFATSLEHALQEGGSAFAVEKREGGGYQLCRRVREEVRQTLERAMSVSERAGQLLRTALGHVYGRNPNPSSGFREAVRAVETVACSAMLPQDSNATLGKVIAFMKDAPQKTKIDLSPRDDFDSVGAVRSMCELLWKSQFDRHGTGSESVPMTVSQEEAETALHLAATLVQWFGSGRLRRA